MAHSNRPYYVSLLTAAELHGASHQAVMEFQVITDRQLATIRAGRSNIVFRYRKDMEAVASGIDERKTDTGYIRIASVELAALDLLRYPRGAGGFDQIATVLVDLGRRIDPGRLAALSGAFERSVVQRLGYLLEWLGYGECTNELHEVLTLSGTKNWVELDPLEGSEHDFSAAVVERAKRWRVKVRRPPEPDS